MSEPDATRRRHDATMLKAIHALQASIDRKHVENVLTLEKLNEKVEIVINGFPGKDPDAHRRYHEAQMEWLELRNGIIKDTIKKVCAAGAIGAVGWLLVAIFQAIKLSIRL